eukprot:TRINITY_DN45242_c0_g1_i1.p1 TRINITY_DN45242_c0_g1~~TRINITY_DN45242_c0_g1_i1.p1  ORF type:complete len:1011 (-),score=202.37 TRINITY_DN45242_c0_g1_i1:126-3158(-)
MAATAGVASGHPQRMLLVEDLTRQCFMGYEDAGADELRGMVRLFERRSSQVSAQQRQVAEQFANTAKMVSLAQQRLQQMHGAEAEAERHAENLTSELASAEQRLTRRGEELAHATAQAAAASAAALAAETRATAEAEAAQALRAAQSRLEAVTMPPAPALGSLRGPPVPTPTPTRPPAHPSRYRTGDDDEVVIADEESDDLFAVEPSFRQSSVDASVRGSQDNSRAGASGLRYLMGRRQAAPGGVSDSAPCDDVVTVGLAADAGAKVGFDASGGYGERGIGRRAASVAVAQDPVAAPSSRSVAAVTATASAKPHGGTSSTGRLALIDRLYEDCVARSAAANEAQGLSSEGVGATGGGSGKRCRADAVWLVLADLAGKEATVETELPRLAALLQGRFGCSDGTATGVAGDAEVSRDAFRSLVCDALDLRRSHEKQRYEEGGGVVGLSEGASTAETGGSVLGEDVGLSCRDTAGTPLTQRSRNMACGRMNTVAEEGATATSNLGGRLPTKDILWSSLPSWSMELSRLSVTDGGALGVEPKRTGDSAPADQSPALSGTAAEHWRAVCDTMGQLCDRAADDSVGRGGSSDGTVGDGFASLLQSMRSCLALFVRCFAEEARARLRNSHASTGRLLEQRRRTVDELGARLEAQDVEIRKLMEERSTLTARADNAESQASHSGALVSTLRMELFQAKDTLARTVAASAAAAPDPAEAPALQRLQTLVETLRGDLEAERVRCAMAEQARGDAERKVEQLEARVREGCFADVPADAQQSALRGLGTADDQALGNGDPHSSVVQRAVDAEQALRSELEVSRSDLGQTSEQEDFTAAVDGAMLQERLSEMHGGNFFDKVSFRRQSRQKRFVRLTFDLRRIEWGQSSRGPFTALSVEAILRVDFGDASRAYRSFEFTGRSGRPSPGLCLSISTPSRSLDLIASSEREVENWVLGLNEVVSYCPERQRLTVQDFLLRRAILRVEDENEKKDVTDSDLDSASTPGSLRGRGGAALKRMLPSRWT